MSVIFNTLKKLKDQKAKGDEAKSTIQKGRNVFTLNKIVFSTPMLLLILGVVIFVIFMVFYGMEYISEYLESKPQTTTESKPVPEFMAKIPPEPQAKQDDGVVKENENEVLKNSVPDSISKKNDADVRVNPEEIPPPPENVPIDLPSETRPFSENLNEIQQPEIKENEPVRFIPPELNTESSHIKLSVQNRFEPSKVKTKHPTVKSKSKIQGQNSLARIAQQPGRIDPNRGAQSHSNVQRNNQKEFVEEDAFSSPETEGQNIYKLQGAAGVKNGNGFQHTHKVPDSGNAEMNTVDIGQIPASTVAFEDKFFTKPNKQLSVIHRVKVIRKLLSKNDFKTAETHLEHLAQFMGDDHPFVLKMRAYIHLKKGQYDLAEIKLRNVLKRNSNDFEATYNLITLKVLANNTKEALNLVNEAIEKYPEKTILFNMLQKIQAAR